MDLTLQLADAPCGLGALLRVECPFGFVGNPHENPVMGPAQFAPQCGANWKCTIELPHIAQTLYAEAFAELGGELLRQELQQLFAVACPVVLAAGLVNLFTDFPVGRDHSGIDGCCQLMLSLNDGLPDGSICLFRVLDDLKLFVHEEPPN